MSNESSSDPEKTHLEDLETRLFLMILISDSQRLTTAKLKSDHSGYFDSLPADPSAILQSCETLNEA